MHIKKWFSKPQASAGLSENYFHTAQSWCDDYYATAVSSRNRWRALSVYGLLPLLALALAAVVMLIPVQHLEPILIQHYSDGVVSVLPAKRVAKPTNASEVESDLVRYVETRESYSAESYATQYRLTMLLSSRHVAEQYVAAQAASNTVAPINVLGNTGTQTIEVDSVLFLDNANKNNPVRHINFHRNLAQVNFSVTTTQNGNVTTVPYTALIGWRYTGTPSNPSAAWLDWNGFQVTHYQVEAQQGKQDV